MKNGKVRFLSFLLLLIMLLNVFTACGEKAPPESSGNPDDNTPDGDYQMPEDEYKLPLEEGYNQLTLYWKYGGTYENCDVWIWWGDVAGKGYVFHECNYGAKVVINVPEGITEVGFIVRKNCSDPGGSSWGNATKDYEQDRFAVIEGKETVIYLKTGDASQYTSNDGGKTLNMIKKFSLAGMTDLRKIEYRINPKTLISSLDQVKVYEGDREIAVSGVSTLGRQSSVGYIEVAEDLDLSKSYRVVIEG